jgi:PAS domain S-box-containing protein
MLPLTVIKVGGHRMVLPEDVHRRIGETAPDGLWVLDGAGRTVHVSTRACMLLGRSEESLAGANPFHLVEVDHPEGLYGLLTTLLAGQTSVPDVQARVRLRGGQDRDLMLRGRSVEDAEAGRLAVFWLSEVSQQELLQEELAFQRDELIEAQQLARMATWRLDLLTREVTWSDAMFNLLGRDRSSGPMSLREVVTRVHPEDQDLIYAAREEIYRVGKLDVSFRYVQPDGATTWLRCRGAVRSARGGQSNVLLSCLLDITQQKETELALTMSARLADLLRALASDANESATVAQALDRMLLRAASFEPDIRAITFFAAPGPDGETVLNPTYPGRQYEGPYRGQDQPTEREWACARRALETRTVVINEYPDHTVEMGHSAAYGGQVFVVTVLTTINTATPDHIRRALLETVSAQLVRVAERERTNAALELARDEALEASRHKSEFLATMSHEIRTPLNGVIGLNDLLLRSELNADQRRIAEGVQVAGQTLRAVINDILDFSKIEAGHLELETVDFAVREVVDGAAALLGERAHEHGIELAASVRGDVPDRLRGDPTRLAQILTNLIGNAVKFTADGEVVVL